VVLDVTPASWLFGAVLVLGALLLVQSGRLWALRRAPRRRLAEHRRQGARGELVAERLLREHGYAVAERQVLTRYDLLVDGEAREVTLRADFLVERGGKTYVAEAKGGEVAGRLETIATRRQVLEYCLAFDVEGVLLVDSARGSISLVQLPGRAASTNSSRLRLIVLLALLCAVAMCAWATL
jgi:hypothetical protein